MWPHAIGCCLGVLPGSITSLTSFFTRLTRETAKEPATKVNINKRSRSRPVSVRTQYRTTRPVSGLPAESMCMTTCHWHQFVGIAGINPVSGVCFGLRAHSALRKRHFSGNNVGLTKSSLQVQVFRSCTVGKKIVAITKEDDRRVTRVSLLC